MGPMYALKSEVEVCMSNYGSHSWPRLEPRHSPISETEVIVWQTGAGPMF